MRNLICASLMLFFISCGNSQEVNAISTVQLKELLAKDKIQLLDVRTPKEIKQGSIDTAIFANYFDDDFAEKAISQLDKNKQVYLYCRTGNRSGKAAKILQEKGYTVVNVLGGYTKWKQEN